MDQTFEDLKMDNSKPISAKDKDRDIRQSVETVRAGPATQTEKIASNQIKEKGGEKTSKSIFTLKVNRLASWIRGVSSKKV